MKWIHDDPWVRPAPSTQQLQEQHKRREFTMERSRVAESRTVGSGPGAQDLDLHGDPSHLGAPTGQQLLQRLPLLLPEPRPHRL